jgi:hypothetical protein
MATSFGKPSQLRPCLSTPPPQVADAARYLDAAVTAHLYGNGRLADDLIRAADMPDIYRWTKPMWANSDVHLVRSGNERVSSVSKELRAAVRMPTKAEKDLIHQRDGYNCRFCGMPVIRPEVRKRVLFAYPGSMRWGPKEAEQHAAFQAMWAQYDHVLPHALGGTNDLSNIVLACAACNFGRGGYSLQDVGVVDPRTRPIVPSSWDGLERFR